MFNGVCVDVAYLDRLCFPQKLAKKIDRFLGFIIIN